MSPMKFLPRLFLVLIVASSLTLSGCGTYMPWFGDEEDEEEDFLSFEDEVPLEEDIESKDDPFASEGDIMEGDQDLENEGTEFASIDQETDKSEIKTDIENLQGQQEALIAKVRELQEIISTLEPKITATQEQLQGSLGSVSQQADYLEPEVQALKQQVAHLQSQLVGLRTKKAAYSKVGASMVFKKEYQKALSAYRTNQYDESILLFQNLAVKNPPVSYKDNIHYWIGSNFVKLEMYDDAIKHFETVLNEFPSGNKAHDSRYMLGVSYHRMGDNSRAMDVLQSALKFNPTAEVRSKIQRELSQIQ